MENAPNRSAGPNWVESPDGEILPSYTGPNAPIYPNEDAQTRRQEIEETHPQFTEHREEYRTDYGSKEELYKPLTKSERARAKAAMTDEDVELATKGIAAARNHLNQIQGK